MPSPSVLDTAFGLHCVAGNEALYRKLLGKFMDQQGDAPQAIRQAIQSGDLELAHRLAHTLKGVAASLGVTSVREAAAEMDAAFKAGEDVALLLPVLQSALTEALVAIPDWLRVAS